MAPLARSSCRPSLGHGGGGVGVEGGGGEGGRGGGWVVGGRKHFGKHDSKQRPPEPSIISHVYFIFKFTTFQCVTTTCPPSHYSAFYLFFFSSSFLLPYLAFTHFHLFLFYLTFFFLRYNNYPFFLSTHPLPYLTLP